MSDEMIIMLYEASLIIIFAISVYSLITILANSKVNDEKKIERLNKRSLVLLIVQVCLFLMFRIV